MLMDKDAIMVAAEMLTGEDFYQSAYGMLFDAMVELFQAGKPVDLITLQELSLIHIYQPSIISYPVVKSADNNEYLTKTFSANDNKLGAIFMDMRNQNDFSDRNTFIYGHNMKVGGEMFSQLNEYASEDFYKAHPYFYIYTPDGKTRTYEVFSARVVKDSAEVYNLNITTDEEFEAYLAECKSCLLYTSIQERSGIGSAKIFRKNRHMNMKSF